MEECLPTTTDLEKLVKIDYKEYRKKIIDIKINNTEYFNNNLKSIYDKYLYLEDNFKKRRLLDNENEIKDVKRIIRNNIYTIIFLTVMLFLFFIIIGRNIAARNNGVALLIYAIVTIRSINKLVQSRKEMKKLISQINNPAWLIKDELNFNNKKNFVNSIEAFNKSDYLNSSHYLSVILQNEKTIPELFWFRSLIYEKINMTKESVKDCETAMLINPKFDKNENAFIKYILNKEVQFLVTDKN